MLDYEAVTREYYAQWLDCDVSEFERDVTYVCSPKRDIALHGYSFPMSLSLFKTGSSVVISYSSEIQEQINQMRREHITVGSFDSHLVDYLKNIFPAKIESSIKFVFERQKPYLSEHVKRLSINDFAVFLDFRLSLGQTEWDGMRAYFETISDVGYCVAKIVDGKAVSMTDAPGMPFMPDMVQEVGISTLPDYRRRGYAKEVVSACISKIISDGKCPMWSCDADNRASEKLAYSAGFRKFCDEYHIDVR